MNKRLAYTLGLTLAGTLVAQAALAATVTISTNTTDPLATADVDGGTAGDIVIDAAGSISASPGPVITINSDNSVTNSGVIHLSNKDGAIGVRIEGGNAGAFLNNGVINLDPKSLQTFGTGKTGLLLTGPAAFTGDITIAETGGLQLYGDDSIGVHLSSDLDGDFLNGGAIVVQGKDSIGMVIDGAITGTFVNSGSMGSGSSEGAATGLLVDTQADFGLLTNSGAIRASSSTAKQAHATIALELNSINGPTSLDNSGAIEAAGIGIGGKATAIIDRTGRLLTITNTGQIQANYQENDNDAVETADTVAIDLSVNTADITITNNRAIGDTDGSTGIIRGDILLGSGDDSIIQGDGVLSGDISFGDGNDSLAVTSGFLSGAIDFGSGTNTFSLGSTASFTGSLATTGGTLSADVLGDVTFDEAIPVALTSLNIGPDVALTMVIDPPAGLVSMFDVSGIATIDSTTTFIPVFSRVLTSETTFDLVRANTITLNAGLPSLSLDDAPFFYTYALDSTFGGATEALQIVVTPKTATELGVTDELLPIYLPFLEASGTNTTVVNAIHSIGSNEELIEGLTLAMPNQTAGSWQMGMLTFDGIAQSALGSKITLSSPSGSPAVFWIEESGSYRDQDAGDEVRGYIASEFRMTGGVDIAAANFERVGVSFTQSYTSLKPDGAPTGPYGITSSWFSAYASWTRGDFKVNGIGSAAFARYRSDRSFDFGDTLFKAKGDWSGSFIGARVEGVYHMEKDGLFMEPRASLAWLSANEDDYSETGDDGIRLSGEDLSLSGIRSEIGAKLGVRLGDQKQILTAELELGLRKDFGTSDEEREFQFVGGASTFSLMTPASDDEAAIIGLNVFGSSNLTSLGFSYKGAFGSEFSDHQVSAVLKTRF